MELHHQIRNPRRLAIGSIRGYRYQLLHTIRAWLQADDNHLIVAEGNEDIDHVLIGCPEESWEEQIKFRSEDIAQSNKAITDAILHSIEAFVRHVKDRCRFRGILRTNALIETDDKTQVGRWISTGEADHEALAAELREILTDDKERLALLDGIVAGGEFERYIGSIEWAPQAGDIAQLEEELGRLTEQRASRRPKAATRNALVAHVLGVLTNADVGKRVLRRIDADLAIGDTILEALAFAEHSERQQTWRSALWSRKGPPSIAVIVFTPDVEALGAAIRHHQSLGASRSIGEVIRSIVRRLDFVAYASIRRSPGKNGQRYVTHDVVRQSRYRLSPSELAVLVAPQAPFEKWLRNKWSTLVEITVEPPETVMMQVAAVLGEAISSTDTAVLEAVSTKLRWVHDVDANHYFTAADPLR